MQTKLTLRLGQKLIARAKASARTRSVSLSQAVARLFEQLPSTPPSLSPWTQKLVGLATRGKRRPLTDDEIRRAHLDRLEAKHQE